MPRLPVDPILDRVVRDLGDRYRGIFGTETVERYVRESYDLLASRPNAGVTCRRSPPGSPPTASTRSHARPRCPARGYPRCCSSACRTPAARRWRSAILRHLAGDRVHVRTAGSEPAGEVRGSILTALDEIGVPIAGEYPKPLTDEVVRAADVVITMGCGDACPVYPGRATWTGTSTIRSVGRSPTSARSATTSSVGCETSSPPSEAPPPHRDVRTHDAADPLDRTRSDRPPPARRVPRTALLVAIVVGSGIAASALSPGDVGLQLLENSFATALGLAVLIAVFGLCIWCAFQSRRDPRRLDAGPPDCKGFPLRDSSRTPSHRSLVRSSAPCWRMSCSTCPTGIASTERADRGRTLTRRGDRHRRSHPRDLRPGAFGAQPRDPAAQSAPTSGRPTGSPRPRRLPTPRSRIGRMFSDTFAGIAPPRCCLSSSRKSSAPTLGCDRRHAGLPGTRRSRPATTPPSRRHSAKS